MFRSGFTLFVIFLQCTIAEKITCPSLNCVKPDVSGKIKQDLCYEHDGKQPVENIKIHECDDYIILDKTQLQSESRMCDFNLLSGEFAWVDETKQQFIESDDPEKS